MRGGERSKGGEEVTAGSEIGCVSGVEQKELDVRTFGRDKFYSLESLFFE